MHCLKMPVRSLELFCEESVKQMIVGIIIVRANITAYSIIAFFKISSP